MAFPKAKPEQARAFQKPKEPSFPFAVGMGFDIDDQACEIDIDEIEGKLVKLYPPKPAGRSTVQNGTFQTKFGDIKIAIWGQEVPKDAVMKPWKILSVNDKFGKITYKIESYDGAKGHVVNEVLSIGNKTEWEEVTANAAARQQTAAPAQQPKPTPQEAGQQSIVNDSPNEAGVELARLAKNLADQHRIVHNTVAATYEDLPIKDDTLQAYVATVWIGLDRAGMVHPNIETGHSEPKVALQDAKDAPWPEDTGKQEKPATGAIEYDPMQWASTIVPSGSHEGAKLASIGKVEIEKLFKYAVENNLKTRFWACVRQGADDLGILPF